MLLFLVAFRKHEPQLVPRVLPIYLFTLWIVIGRPLPLPFLHTLLLVTLRLCYPCIRDTNYDSVHETTSKESMMVNFDVLLTVHLIIILVINQLNAQNLVL